jgi:hypothetical protein
LAETSFAHTNRIVSWTLSIASISFAIIAILTVGASVFTYSRLEAIPADIAARVSTVLPDVAYVAAQTAVPEAVQYAAGTQVATEFEGLRTEIYAAAGTLVVEAVQTQAQLAAGTAVAQAERGKFTIIVASNIDLQAALASAESLRSRGYDPVVYKIGDFFTTTIGAFATEEELLPELLKAKAQITSSAYFIDLSRSCPFTRLFSAGYFGCSLTPWE